MEEIRFQQKHLKANQELDRISENVSTILRIPRSTNNLRENNDIGGIND